MSDGRFMLGLGVSGPQVIEGWHGIRFDRPLHADARDRRDRAAGRAGERVSTTRAGLRAATARRRRQGAAVVGQSAARHPDLPGDARRREAWSSPGRSPTAGWARRSCPSTPMCSSMPSKRARSGRADRSRSSTCRRAVTWPSATMSSADRRRASPGWRSRWARWVHASTTSTTTPSSAPVTSTPPSRCSACGSTASVTRRPRACPTRWC